MSHADPIRALILPFEKELLPYPDRCFLMRAEASDSLGDEWRPRLLCEQSFLPAHNRLRTAGFETVDRLSGMFATGLCLLTKHKAENRANIARAWSLLKPGGTLVCGGANALGAASLEREFDDAVGLAGRLSKHQSRVFWAQRPSGATPEPASLRQWAASGRPHPVADTGFIARAGCFSHDRIDRGSQLLAKRLPETMSGRVADLGAGWGYLSVCLLRDFPAVTSVDLFEAEAMALEDAKANIAALVPDRAPLAHYHWADVSAALPDAPPYDWIMSNPPFHEGRKADPAIGRSFITAAWRAIRRRGKFLLVANQSLPYEAELRRRFRQVELLCAAEGFKIYLASDRIDRDVTCA